MPQQFENVVCPPLTIQESGRRSLNPLNPVGHHQISNVAAGANANKAHRNFKWLPWYQGDISETALDRDVLTGPMSGCILVGYRRNGVRVVGHIGTVTVTAAVPAAINTAVKALWTNFMNAHPADILGGFNPAGHGVPMHPPAQPGDIAGETWGLFAMTGEFYAVQVYKQQPNAHVGHNDWRVAAVHQVPSMTAGQLLHI